MSEGRPAAVTPAPEALQWTPDRVSRGIAAIAGSSARELWLAAHFPRLPLEALLPVTNDASAIGVIEANDPRRCLVACNDRAARGGITAGMGQNAALALMPGLELRERRPAAEAALLDRLARWALQFTPVVSIESPDALLAEVRGSLKLFGGARTLYRRAHAGLQTAGLQAYVALAPTPRGALWLARAGLGLAAVRVDAMPGLAAQLPLSCLHWPLEIVEVLSGLGTRTIADLARLPRAGFAQRFGPALLDELDEGLGRRRQLRRRHTVPERFDEQLELPIAAGSAAGVELAAVQLLTRLAAFLRSRAAGLFELRVDLLHRDCPPTRIRLRLTRPSGDALQLHELLRERLAHSRLPAAVTALRCRSGVLLPLTLHEAGLFEQGRAADPEASAHLLERLRARLGADSVFGVCPVPEHRPECAWRIAEPGTAAPLPGHWPGSRPARPLWVLTEPQRLDGWNGVLVTGPERIETGWWDGHDVRRDYYVALTDSGARLWIFRERPPGQDWFLHGVFG